MIILEEKILVGLDDSEESWNAFDYAILEAKKKNLEKITVLHSKEGGGKTDLAEYRAGEEILERAESLGEKEDIKVETELLMRGVEPDNDIVKFAEENDFNHIIVGHRGRSGIRRVVLGSVAGGVVEKAHCMVTVVRAEPFIRKAGGRIDGREIEHMVEEHPSVYRCGVIGAPDEEKKEKLVAFIETNEGYEPTEDMIKDHMQKFFEVGRLEMYELPDEIKFVEKMPETGAGTIDREKLKDKYL